MLKCTGVCVECGRCIDSENVGRVGTEKTKMLAFPKNFIPDRSDEKLGAAFDLGTTTVAGMLWDFQEEKLLSATVKINPQIKFGKDVISRIAYCGEDEKKLLELRKTITACMNEIMNNLCAKAGRNVLEISKITVCGNTTMSHIFAGYSPKSLAFAPFSPAYAGTLKMTPKKAFLDMAENGQVTVIPSISGHIGGDVTAGIVATRILEKEGLSLLIDIGTNGEILLAEGNKALVCSAAAGPAFEGTVLENGMKGSEIIDVIAQMLEEGLINESGRLEATERTLISQKDIRQVQLAKGAIRGGIEIMLKYMGKAACDIDRIVLVGTFGNNINAKSAVRIGLIPKIPVERIMSAGSAAGAGALMTLVSEKEMNQAEEIPGRIKHIELAEDPEFQEIYLKAMEFHQL